MAMRDRAADPTLSVQPLQKYHPTRH
jgi:hypothetical protein